MEVTIHSLKDNKNVVGHIVVCGIHSSIYHFILPLRSNYLKKYQYIVIITGGVLPTEIWESIARFPRIFLINGSPLSQETLLKANIIYADKAVILGHDSTLKSDVNDEMLDAQTIFIYKAIRKCNPDMQILTELVYSSKIEFLLPKKKDNLNYTLSTLYAAGEVYISSIIDTLTSQAFYNPHIVTIMQQILKGGSDSRDEDLKFYHPDLY